MNETLLFSIGAGVFAVTITAAVMCGYYAFSRAYNAEVAKSVAYVNGDEADIAVRTGIPDIQMVLNSKL